MFGAIGFSLHRPLAAEMEARLAGMAEWPGAARRRYPDNAPGRRALQGRGPRLKAEAMGLADDGILADAQSAADFGRGMTLRP